MGSNITKVTRYLFCKDGTSILNLQNDKQIGVLKKAKKEINDSTVGTSVHIVHICMYAHGTHLNYRFQLCYKYNIMLVYIMVTRDKRGTVNEN